MNAETLTALIEDILRDAPLNGEQLSILSEISSGVVQKYGKRAVLDPQSFVALKAQLQLVKSENAAFNKVVKEFIAAGNVALRDLDRYPEPVSTDDLFSVMEKAKKLLAAHPSPEGAGDERAHSGAVDRRKRQRLVPWPPR